MDAIKEYTNLEISKTDDILHFAINAGSVIKMKKIYSRLLIIMKKYNSYNSYNSYNYTDLLNDVNELDQLRNENEHVFDGRIRTQPTHICNESLTCSIAFAQDYVKGFL